MCILVPLDSLRILVCISAYLHAQLTLCLCKIKRGCQRDNLLPIAWTSAKSLGMVHNMPLLNPIENERDPNIS